MDGITPICPYCGKFSVRSTGAELYAHRPELADKQFYRCVPCEAWVGVHAMTGAPLGTLANSKLRKARSAAHAVFDPVWNFPAQHAWLVGCKGTSKKKKSLGYYIVKYRTQAYEQLAKLMDLPVEMCHIAMFNEDQCQQAIVLIEAGGIVLR